MRGNHIQSAGNHRNRKAAAGRFGTKGKTITAALTAAAVMAVISVLVFSGNNTIQAQEDHAACKMYTSIQIRPGDTLWDIALQHVDGHYSSIQEYIDEVMHINELTTDTIHAGAYLVIPYYQA